VTVSALLNWVIILVVLMMIFRQRRLRWVGIVYLLALIPSIVFHIVFSDNAGLDRLYLNLFQRTIWFNGTQGHRG